MNPVKLYKYRNFNTKFHLDGLKKNAIYFSSPEKLNDPVNVMNQFVYDDYSDEELIQLSKEKISSGKPDLTPGDVEKTHNELFDLKFAREGMTPESQYEFMNEHFNGHLGIFSLSATNNNIAMWNKYSDDSTGFCIEYDYYLLRKWIDYFVPDKTMQIKGFFKVNYVDELPEFHYKNFSVPDEIKAFTTKKMESAFEQEYRLFILDKTNFSYTLNPRIIKSVYLGHNISKENEDLITEIVNMVLPRVQIFKGKKSHTDYLIEFTELTNHSILRAEPV